MKLNYEQSSKLCFEKGQIRVKQESIENDCECWETIDEYVKKSKESYEPTLISGIRLILAWFVISKAPGLITRIDQDSKTSLSPI